MLAAALLALPAFAPAQDVWTQEQMAADLEQLLVAVREQWSYLEDRTANNGLDLDAHVRRGLGPRAAGASSRDR